MQTRRKLPVGGVQSFKEIRNEYDVYIDKTIHIYNLATRYKTVFLSRPRRFGKSLFCSTIASVFKNEKELFDGLAISNTDWEWKEYPVVHLDLSAANYTENGIDALKAVINSHIKTCANNYMVNMDFTDFISINFRQLLLGLSEKYGKAVVIIDEYDYPLLSTIDQESLNQQLREELKGFYGVLKQCSEHIRFVFITGVTKFAQISMFSGMNQPNDISMDSEYCDICGITQKELENYFEPEINFYAEKYGGKVLYLNKLREYYDGYYFSKNKISVYNTYGLLNHFEKSANFTPYWSLSGAPSFVLKYLEAKTVNAAEIEEAQMEDGNFGNYKDNNISLFPLLYQAGYLTISGYDERTGFYKLNYPNIEVRKTFAEFLSENYSTAETTLKKSVSVRLVDFLLENKLDEFMNLLKVYLQKVDYSLSSKITEYYFEFAVSNIINMLGLVCVNEVHTANGRMDSVIYAGEYIYVLEFKADKPVTDALWQIEDRDYDLIYRDSGRKIIKLGIIFSREKRNIIEWCIKGENNALSCN